MEFSVKNVSKSHGMTGRLSPMSIDIYVSIGIGCIYHFSLHSFPLSVGLLPLKEVKIEVFQMLYCFGLLSSVLWQLFHHHKRLNFKRLNFKSLHQQKLPKCRAIILISLSSLLETFVELF